MRRAHGIALNREIAFRVQGVVCQKPARKRGLRKLPSLTVGLLTR